MNHTSLLTLNNFTDIVIHTKINKNEELSVEIPNEIFETILSFIPYCEIPCNVNRVWNDRVLIYIKQEQIERITKLNDLISLDFSISKDNELVKNCKSILLNNKISSAENLLEVKKSLLDIRNPLVDQINKVSIGSSVILHRKIKSIKVPQFLEHICFISYCHMKINEEIRRENEYRQAEIEFGIDLGHAFNKTRVLKEIFNDLKERGLFNEVLNFKNKYE